MNKKIIIITSIIALSLNFIIPLFASLELPFEPQEEVYYYIINAKTGLALDGDLSREEQLLLKEKSNSSYQHWKFVFVKFSGNFSLYQIVNRGTGMALDIYKEDYREGQKVIAWRKKDALKAEINQLFWIKGNTELQFSTVKGGNSLYTKHTSYVLSADGNLEKVIIRSDNSDEKRDFGYWKIQALNFNK